MTPWIHTIIKLTAFVVGLGIVVRTLFSAVRTFVLPRGATDRLVGNVFRGVRWLFHLRMRFAQDYLAMDGIFSLYAPIAIMLLLPAWLFLILLGYAIMFWATGQAVYDAIILSGSSLFTLGFARSDVPIHMVLTFTEATIGLILVALLMAYLPAMYSAFSNRERAVTMLEVRAGSPPSATEMLNRMNRLRSLDGLHDVWLEWEGWFAEIQESHSTLSALVFFRSQNANRSWLTASGTVLDAAALAASAIDMPRDVQAELCIRAGYLALRNIADYFPIHYNPHPQFPDDPITISYESFLETCDYLAAQGVPIKADREQAYRDFAGWRVNYDDTLNALARLTLAPPVPWINNPKMDRMV